MAAKDDRREPTFPEPEDGEERAKIAIEEAGGLPDDNPFTETVEELREKGESWQDITNLLYQIADRCGEAAMEEDATLVADWEVTAKVPTEDTPSGYYYETYERPGETAAEAEQRVRDHTGYEVVEERTEQVGYGKVS